MAKKNSRRAAIFLPVALHAVEDSLLQRRDILLLAGATTQIDRGLPVLTRRKLRFRERADARLLPGPKDNISQIGKIPASCRFRQRIH